MEDAIFLKWPLKVLHTEVKAGGECRAFWIYKEKKYHQKRFNGSEVMNGN